MATSDQQKKYQRRWREKAAKIKSLTKQIDTSVAALEKLPKCEACQKIPAKRCMCTHAHKALNETTEIARCVLEQLEH